MNTTPCCPLARAGAGQPCRTDSRKIQTPHTGNLEMYLNI